MSVDDERTGVSTLLKLSPKWSFPIRLAPSLGLLLATAIHAQTGTITGQVFCSDTQKPARFARVEIQDYVEDPAEHSLINRGRSAQTQADGTFVLPDIPVGSYDLLVTYPGYVNVGDWSWLRTRGDADTLRLLSKMESQVQVTVQPDRSTRTIATIYRGAELDGSVFYDDGSPASGFAVRVDYVVTPAGDASSANTPATTRPLNHDLYATTDSHGRFQITGLVDGTYLISTRREAYHPLLATYFGNTVEASKATLVKVKTGEVRSDLDMQVNLTNLHQVRGVLTTADHQPVPKVVLQLNFPDAVDGGTSLFATTADDGSFVFPSVPDGDFLLKNGQIGREVPAHLLPITVSGQDITDIVLTAKP